MSKFSDEDVSDGENDDAWLSDIQAISGACLPSSLKANLDGDGAATENPIHGAATTGLECADSDDDFELVRRISGACLPSSSKINLDCDGTVNDNPISGAATTGSKCSDSDDDFDLLRSIQQQYGGRGGSDSDPAEDGMIAPRPLITVHPIGSDLDDDDDDDFNTLRAIRMRFGQYCTEESSNAGGNEGDSFFNELEKDLNNGLAGGFRAGIRVRDGGSFGPAADAETLGADYFFNPNLSGMPQWALAFHDAIKKNRLLQKHIQSKKINVEARMEEISVIRKRLQTIVEYHVQCKRRVRRMLSQGQDDRMLLISTPENPSALSVGPPENTRVVNYRMAFKVHPQSFPKEKWSRKERENLKKGIFQQFQNRILQKSMDVLNVSEGPENVEVDQVMSMIGQVEMTPEELRAFLPKVDWDLLASSYVPRRSGLECQARWLNYEDPLINWGKWTHMEDKSLLYTIQQKGMNNWIDKAISLGTKRTPYQCLVRYQRSLNASLIKRDWTSDEDANLIAAVEAFGESNWEVVASCLEGRTGPQCSNRWLKTLHPSKQKKGRWSPDEDKRLTIAVKVIGNNNKNWCKIAQFVPGRTQARCRERWMNCLDPNLKFGEWSEEDDLKLKQAVQINGFCWSKVALCVPPRTDNQCRRRWASLFPDEFCRLQYEREVKRKALPSNFVDREPNRPNLGANDFQSLTLLEATAQVDDVNVSQKRKKRSNGRKMEVPLKTINPAIFNIPKKPRSRRERKVSNYLDSFSPESILQFPVDRKGSLSLEADGFDPLPPVESTAEVDSVYVSQQKKRKSNVKKFSDSSFGVDTTIIKYSGKLNPRRGRKLSNYSETASPESGNFSVKLGSDITLSNERERANSSADQKDKHAEIDQSPSSSELIPSSLKTLEKGADQKRKKRGTKSCPKPKKNITLVHNLKSSSREGGDEDTSSTSDVNLMNKASEVDLRRNRRAPGTEESIQSEKLDTSSGDDVNSCGRKVSVPCRSKIMVNKRMKRRLDSVETEEWEDMTLMEMRKSLSKRRRKV